MTCTRIAFPDGTSVISCTRGQQLRRKCAFCGAESTKLCDGKRFRNAGPCDKPLCDGCAQNRGEVDYCPNHREREPGEEG